MKTSAFSLIELMVVIAIIAIVAAVAVPTYKSYLVRSKFATILPTLYSLMDSSLTFSAIHGRMGRFEDLGYSAADLYSSDPTGSFDILTPAATTAMLGPIILPGTGLLMGDAQGLSSDPPCGASGILSFYLDPEYLGFPHYVNINVTGEYGHMKNGEYFKFIYYGYSNPNDPSASTSGTDDIFPGAVNFCGDPSCSYISQGLQDYTINYLDQSQCQS